ncbi:asparagine synthase (glutamine-hydrolyzing) [Methanobacterium formicicum]|uniref:Putative asparagine synthetase [glutamine-hydrolyzing] n=1 Tax=Methanobacterium formicicum (strain DSM 3637 / PP1) TaxID=1204725 RepID=K2R1E4_METFP|nr:asparagine synthase (glutamine-hydrolyzing) [Methanobacterium formicicum]EKF85052.1 asparagine synthase [Methanobacterium formicicum DSM 3637]
MCAITGIIGENIGDKLYNMLLTLKHRGPDKSGVFVDGKISHGNLEDLIIPHGNIGLGHNLLSIVGSEVVQPMSNGKIILVCNGEIYNYSQLHSDLEDTSYDFKTDSDSEVVLALLTKHYQGSLLKTVPLVLEELDGDYAFAAYDGEDLVAVRDPLGVKPLYYGDENGLFGFASEKKALWEVKINKTHSLPPNFMLHNKELVPLPQRQSLPQISSLQQISSGKENFSSCVEDQFQNESYDFSIESEFSKSTRVTSDKKYLKEKEEIKKVLGNYIRESVKKRTRGLDKVGILFSGGVDSTLLAVLCADLGIETELYAVGSEGSPDRVFASKVAEYIGLPLHIRMVDEGVVREYIPRVLSAIEEWNVMKLGVGMTAYLAAEMAHHHGQRVILSGQGADELFAGYHRYLSFYQQKGEEAQEDLQNDVANLYHVNLERDDKVTMASSVELRVPYLDLQIINMAMNIPMYYKINGPDDKLRKCILREVANQMGVPFEIVKRPKKAAQYGSGIHKILRKKVLKDSGYMDKLKKSFKFIDI